MPLPPRSTVPIDKPPRSTSDEQNSGLDRRTRICIWIILIGLANFLAYGILYTWFYGEAVNGVIRVIDGHERYFLQSGQEVSRWVFLYSGVHSISIWPTVAAIMLAMLTLAKDRILGVEQWSVARGRAMVTILAVVIGIICGIMTYVFTKAFVDRLEHPEVVSQRVVAPTAPGRLPATPGIVLTHRPSSAE